MGFRSGEFAGQSNTPTPWSFNQLLVLLRAPPLAMVLLPGSLYTFPHTYGPWPPWLRAWCPCTVMRRAPKHEKSTKQSTKARSRGLLLLNRCGWQLWGGAILWRPILEQICTWLSLQTDYTIRPSWTPLCRGVNNWHSNPEKFGRLIGCAPGHQVTPHLRAFFCAGGWGDSFAPRGPHITLNEWKSGVLTHDRRWCGAGIMRMREYTLPTAAVDVGLISCEWECPSTHGSRWCGAGNMWIRVSSTHGSRWCGAGIMWMRVPLYTWQPLMWGWFHVNESAPLHMAAADVGLVTCESECPLHMAAADVGLVTCESECPLHTADCCWGAGIVWIREQCLPDRQPLMRGWYRVNEWGANWLWFAHGRMPLWGGGLHAWTVGFSVWHLRRHENP